MKIGGLFLGPLSMETKNLALSIKNYKPLLVLNRREKYGFGHEKLITLLVVVG